MAWFQEDMVEFFGELELNNDREWFGKNKKRYEQSVKEPMEAFAAEMIERMKEIDPEIEMQPKDAVFRIYRDVRFSKDKAPYKTNAGLFVCRGGKRDLTGAGVYFHVDARQMGIAGGFYSVEPSDLMAIRKHIVENPEEFEERLNDPEFVSKFGTVVGEENKVLPAEFREAAKIQPLLFKKQFYYWAQHPADEAFREDLAPFVMEHVRAGLPMTRFLGAALGRG